jgi:hypothetical protein
LICFRRRLLDMPRWREQYSEPWRCRRQRLDGGYGITGEDRTAAQPLTISDATIFPRRPGTS